PPAPRSCHPYRVATVYEDAGGIGGLRRLADAWHMRVMADEEVSHAFSHGYRPDHSERLAAYWAEALGGPPLYSDAYATRPRWCGSTAATARTRRWTGARSPASTRPW